MKGTLDMFRGKPVSTEYNGWKTHLRLMEEDYKNDTYWQRSTVSATTYAGLW
jgi:hypothetical protein